MPNTPPQLISGGDIYPNRFVQLDTSEDHQALLGGDNSKIIGVAAEGTTQPPLSDLVTTNYAARDGDSLRIYGEGDICLLEVNDTITAGERLKSDASGYGVGVATTGTTIQNIGAIALQSGVANDKVLVVVQIYSERPALS